MFWRNSHESSTKMHIAHVLNVIAIAFFGYYGYQSLQQDEPYTTAASAAVFFGLEVLALIALGD